MAKVIELSEEMIARLKANKEAKALCDNKDWTPIQLLFQDVQAVAEIATVVQDKHTSITDQIQLLREKIEADFVDDEELKKALLETIPAYSTITYWTRLESWKRAIQDRIRSIYVFSNANQLRVLDALLKAATSAPGSGGSVKAQELYFRLEGSLGADKKTEEKDATYERYKNLQKTLHSKK